MVCWGPMKTIALTLILSISGATPTPPEAARVELRQRPSPLRWVLPAALSFGFGVAGFGLVVAAARTPEPLSPCGGPCDGSIGMSWSYAPREPRPPFEVLAGVSFGLAAALATTAIVVGIVDARTVSVGVGVDASSAGVSVRLAW